MLKTVITIVLLALPARAASPDWNQRLAEAMPLLGHRNWILVVDSAYPLQTSPGIETIETNASQIDVVRAAMAAIAAGASAYGEQVERLERGYRVESLRHEKLISNIDEAGKRFHVLVLKTNMTIRLGPYSFDSTASTGAPTRKGACG